MNEKALMLCDCPLDRLFQSFLFFSWIELNWDKRTNDNEIDCWLICLLLFLSFFLSLDWLIELNWMSNKQNKSSINLGGWLLIIGFIQLIVVMIDHFFDFSFHFIDWLIEFDLEMEKGQTLEAIGLIWLACKINSKLDWKMRKMRNEKNQKWISNLFWFVSFLSCFYFFFFLFDWLIWFLLVLSNETNHQLILSFHFIRSFIWFVWFDCWIDWWK